jgi:hypothetical protein
LSERKPINVECLGFLSGIYSVNSIGATICGLSHAQFFFFVVELYLEREFRRHRSRRAQLCELDFDRCHGGQFAGFKLRCLQRAGPLRGFRWRWKFKKASCYAHVKKVYGDRAQSRCYSSMDYTTLSNIVTAHKLPGGVRIDWEIDNRATMLQSASVASCRFF